MKFLDKRRKDRITEEVTNFFTERVRILSRIDYNIYELFITRVLKEKILGTIRTRYFFYNDRSQGGDFLHFQDLAYYIHFSVSEDLDIYAGISVSDPHIFYLEKVSRFYPYNKTHRFEIL